MTDSHRPEDVSVYNERSLQRLAWAIEASVGQFQLIFAHCNYASVRSQLVERLQHICSVDIHILTLKESDRTLYATIQAALGETQPAAVMVLGLESVHHIDQMLAAADQVREEFRKHCHFPLVLWVNDAVGQKLMELAPNFVSWGTRRKFAIALDDLANWLRQTAEQCFANPFNSVPNEGLQAAELEAARQDLLKAESTLDAELEANLESLLGFAQESDRKLDAALEHYQRAALLWQQLNQLQQQGYTLVRIAFCYHLKALQYQEKDNPYSQLTRDYLQQWQEIFERIKRSDLIANSITTLGKILRDLQDWELLQTLAQIALQLHETENNLLELAQDYGFLAEVALAQERWTDANQFAQRALDVLSPIASEAVRLSHSSRYRFSLALAQYQLNQIQEAISNLKAAKATCNPLDDLKLYLDILSQLQRFYFEQKNYLEAYEIKQKQRSVEQQFGLRAFIGAGRLESQHQENLAQAQTEAQGTIAPEMIASGRQRDVEQLVERIIKNETKLIVIHGQSGVGKSSLVNAGLIPALQGKQIGIQTVLVVPIRVYTNWVEELGQLLAQRRQEKGIDDRNTISPDNLNSTAAIWEQLHQNDQLNRRTVLIFDQFEEFFFACPLVERRKFFEFLGECLQILSVKVVLSLREDYLHYLLECNRLLSPGISNHGILSEDVLYPLNNFPPNEARRLIEQLTERANFHLESGLIDKLVDDLASELDCVRPIELQVVGAQLQAEQINTLAQYQAYGSKEELVQRYLAEVVADCGEENQQLANLILYLLTDEKETRPLKTRAELERELIALAADTSQLGLVVAILVKSGLVFELLETPAERYQLVHDYLAAFIRRQQEPKLNRLKAELEQERQQREKAETLSRLSQEELAQAKRKARQQVLVGTGILAVTLIASAGVWALSGMRMSDANTKEMEADKRVANADKREVDANRRVANANIRVVGAEKRVKDAAQREKESQQRVTEANKQVEQAKTREANANKQVQTAQQTVQQAKKDLAAAAAQRDRVEREAKQRTETAQQEVNEANQQLAVAQARQQEAQVKEREAQQELYRAEANLADARQEITLAEEQRQVATQGKNLERAGVSALWQFEYSQLDALLVAMQAGTELKGMVKGKSLQNYPAFSPIFALQQILSRIRERNQLRGHESAVWSVSFSPDGQTIASASVDRTVRLWDRQGNPIGQPFKGHEGTVYSVSFSPDGQTIASASVDRTVRLWDRQGNPIGQPFKGHQSSVNSVSFSPDGQTIASALSDGTVRLWDRQGNPIGQPFKGHQSSVNSVSFSRDGQTIASASVDGTVRLWDRQGNPIGQPL
nr:hypothetical protein [Symplocastrum torsivum CPER-KK1]